MFEGFSQIAFLINSGSQYQIRVIFSRSVGCGCPPPLLSEAFSNFVQTQMTVMPNDSTDDPERLDVANLH
jgi:hypothetical protein